MKRALFAAAAVVVLAMAGGSGAQPTQPPAAAGQASQTVHIHAGRLLADPASGRVLRDQTIVVVDGRVQEIRAGFVPGPRVVDLRDAFVLPGLIDSHVHLTSEQNPNSRLENVTQSSADQAMAGARFARRTLMAGFTTVADLGANNDAIFALRDAVRRGDVPGPRILASGGAISAHGGHGDANGYREDVAHTLRRPSICSGADDCRRAVREQVMRGADLIKVHATGGVLSITAAGLSQQLSQEELSAIVQAAHSMGRIVTAHAHGGDGINDFLRAGGDSIEHGTYLDAEGIRLLRREGRYLVPTLLAGDFVARVANSPQNFFTPQQTEKARQAGPQMLDMAARAHRGGVRIAFGTDSGVSAHGDNAQEFALLVRAGMTPLQAIQSATTHAAAHLRIAEEAGAIRAGMPADIVAVRGDPLSDVRALERMAFVMRQGEVHRQE